MLPALDVNLALGEVSFIPSYVILALESVGTPLFLGYTAAIAVWFRKIF